MKLLMVVLNSSDKIEEVLEGLIEVGVTGATVVDCVGMGSIIEGVPLFAGLRNVFRAAKPRNNMLFSVIRATRPRRPWMSSARSWAASRGEGAGISVLLPSSG